MSKQPNPPPPPATMRPLPPPGPPALPPVRSEPLLAAYDRFQHLDRLFEMVGDSDGTENTDPFHMATRDLWRAIKESLGHTANAKHEGQDEV